MKMKSQIKKKAKKEKNRSEIVEDFFNTPKLKKRISIKEIKEKYKEQYG